jgi:tetratricopeptide (TPR) repeat protein
MTFVERCLLAGRVVWFYLSKLLWPADLVFFYPRWQVSQAVGWQYLYPATALLLLACLWALRRRWRAPLAGLLFFIGTLFPVLGFLNVYPFVYAFVADHYQYLASLGIITLTAAGVALLLGRWGLWHRPAGNLLCLALLAILGTASWRQSQMYANRETLYRVTMDKNPECWAAPYDLGTFLSHTGRLTEAIAQFRRAIEIKPDYALAYNNLGSALTELGRFDEAVSNFQRAVKIQPDFVEVYGNLGTVLGQMGKFDEAIACFHRALAIRPDYVAAHSHLGNTLALAGRLPEAMAQFEAALDSDPSDAETHCYLGNVLARQGQLDEAIGHYRTALERQPDSAEFLCRLGSALACRGRFDEALASCQRALELQPNNAFVHNSLALVLDRQRRYEGAIRQYRRALELQSGNVEFQKNLAWLLATAPETRLRNANQICGGKRADILDTLAAAYAEAGWFSEAVVAERKALELASRQSDHVLAEAMRARLALYESGRPYRQTR